MNKLVKIEAMIFFDIFSFRINNPNKNIQLRKSKILAEFD